MTAEMIGPDFLCIGMQKAGTGWIYDALAMAPGCQVMPVKEFHHFDMAEKGCLGSDVHVKRLKRALQNNIDKLPTEKIAEFKTALDKYIQKPSLSTYLQLFTAKGAKISGDLTPAYSLLTKAEVERIRDGLPAVKVILSVREPRSRAWSHFNMYLRKQMANAGISSVKERQTKIQEFATLDRLIKFSRTPNFESRSYASSIFETWATVFKDILVVDFRSIVESPDIAFSTITSFLGCQPTQAPNIENRKAKDIKAQITNEQSAYLDELFADEISRMKKAFPAIAALW